MENTPHVRSSLHFTWNAGRMDEPALLSLDSHLPTLFIIHVL